MKSKCGITTHDIYDFDPIVAKSPLDYLKKGNNYGVFRALGNILGPREDDPIWMRPLINLRSSFPTVWK